MASVVAGSLGNVMAAWGRAEVDEQQLGHSSDEGNSEICRRKRPRSGYPAAYSDTSGWWLQHRRWRGPDRRHPEALMQHATAGRTVARLPLSRLFGWATHYPTTAQYYTPIASESAASATREKNLHMMPSRRPEASPPPAQQLVAAGQTHAIGSLVPGLDG